MTASSGPASETVLDFERPIVELERQVARLRGLEQGEVEFGREIQRLETKAAALRKQIFSKLDPWQRVQLARHGLRPTARDVIAAIIDDAVFLAGDRCSGDDPTVLGALGWLDGDPLVIVAQQRDGKVATRASRRTGPARRSAVGLRKACRLYDLAGRFRLPLVTFVDGAALVDDPLEGAELGLAVAGCLQRLANLPGPTLAVVLGELAGSVGLAFAACDRVLALEHAVCSVAAPEDAASRLWADADRFAEAAGALVLRAEQARRQGLVDDVIEEPAGGAHRRPEATAEGLASALRRHLLELSRLESASREDAATARRAKRRARYLGAFAAGRG